MKRVLIGRRTGSATPRVVTATVRDHLHDVAATDDASVE